MPYRAKSHCLKQFKNFTCAVSTAALIALAPTLSLAAGSVTFGQPVEPAGLDPTVGAAVASGEVTWQNIFEGLVAVDRAGNIVPQLATDWTISDDGLTYTFNLRPEVSFHNGVAFDSSVAKFTIERIISDASTNGQKAYYTVIDSVDAPDSSTVVLHLSKPSSNLLYWLGFPTAVMVEPSSVETNKSAPVGTGPFKFDEWRKGDRVLMSAYEGYWGEKPELDAVTARFISDPQAQAAAIMSHDIDVFGKFEAPELFANFKSDDSLTTHVGVGEMEVIAGMNNARPPFDDIRVRQALMMAVDRATLIQGVESGYGTPIGSHFSPASPYYVDLTDEYSMNLEKAQQLLAEAGYPDGFEFTMKVPTRSYATRSAEILQALFLQIGVMANIESSDFPATWIQDVFKDTNYDMTIIGHAEALDIGIYARHPYYFNYNNPKFDAVMHDIDGAVTPEQRAEGFKKAQEILAHDVPALFLYSAPKLGVWDAKLTGVWENGPVPSNDMTDVRWTE